MRQWGGEEVRGGLGYGLMQLYGTCLKKRLTTREQGRQSIEEARKHCERNQGNNNSLLHAISAGLWVMFMRTEERLHSLLYQSGCRSINTVERLLL